MRLLFAHDHRFQHGADGEFYTVGSFPANIWNRYLAHFEELHVIARDGGTHAVGESLARADRDGVTFEFLPSLSTLRQLIYPSRQVQAQMRSAILSCDAVIARLPSEIGMFAVKHARDAGKPYGIEVVGCAWDASWNYGTISGKLYAPLSLFRNRRAISTAPLVTYVTSSWLQQRYPTDGTALSASDVSLARPNPVVLKRREDRLSGLAAGSCAVLGTIASLHVKSKGVQTALAALARLRKSGLKLTYRILGSGPVEPWRRLAERLGVDDLVHFDGSRTAGEGVFRWLDGIDVYLQPSLQEGLPRATIEAMSRGAACIGSTCGGLPELLPEDRLHRPGDVRALAERIELLVSDPAAIAAASRRDRNTAAAFDPEQLEARRSEFYALLRHMAEAR